MKKLQLPQKKLAAGVVTSFVVPATLALLPVMRKRNSVSTVSIPSLAIMGGLWLWQRHRDKRSTGVAQSSSASPI